MSKGFFPPLVALFISFVILGGTMYWKFQPKLPASESVQQTQTALPTTISSLKTEVPTSKPVTQSPSNEHPCDRKLNHDPATTNVLVSSKGIKIQIPYNPKWAFDEPLGAYKLNSEKSISFGYLKIGEACGLHRQGSLRFLPAQDFEQVVSRVTAENPGPLLEYKPTKEFINGFAYVKYSGGGYCSMAFYEILGKKFNYELSYHCYNDFELLDQLIKTVTLD